MPAPIVNTSRMALIHAFSARPAIAVLVGTVMLLVGISALSYTLVVGLIAVKVLGLFFLGGAFVHAFMLPAAKDWQGVVWHLLGIALYSIAGLVIFRDPMGSIKLVTLVIGVLFFVGGFTRIGFAMALRGAPGWSFALFNGVVSVVLGLLIVFEWPDSSYWAVGVLVAIDLLVSGAMLLALGLSGTPLPESRQSASTGPASTGHL